MNENVVEFRPTKAEMENEKERDVRQALEAQLNSGESLLAYTSGKIPGLVTGQPCHLGLTENRLILLLLKRTLSSAQVLSVKRDGIKTLKLKWGGFTFDQMQLKLPKNTLTVSISGGDWRKRAKEFTRIAEQPPQTVSLGIVEARQSLIRQAQDFQELGFLASAQHTLNEALQNDPALSMNPSVGQLQAQLAETQLAFRVGAGFLFAFIGMLALFSLSLILAGEGLAGFTDWYIYIIVYICLALYALFLGVAGVALWQGKGEQRGSTIQAAFAVFVYSVISFCTDGNIIGLIYALSFSGPIILVLTGKSNRWRTWLAIAIYVIGCLGVPFVATLQESTATDHYNQGVKYQQQGQLDLAIKEYTQAIEIDPKLPQAYLNRGNAYIAQGDYDRAIADCHKAIALNPKFAEAYHNRGLAYALKGDYAFALIDLDTAIALDPKNDLPLVLWTGS